MGEVYKLKYLKGLRLKVFLAVADCIIPPDHDSPGGGSMLTAGVVDWSLERISPSLRSQLLFLLLALEFMGIPFGGLTFTRNSMKAKLRQLRFMESCPLGLLRMGFFGLKSYTCMGYYTREDIWKTIDYEGPMLPDVPFPDKVIRGLCQGKIEMTA